MSESLFSRAAVAEPRPAAEPAEAPTIRDETPRGIALRRTAPLRALAEPTPAATEELGSGLARLAADRPTPAPRQRGWLSMFGGGR